MRSNQLVIRILAVISILGALTQIALANPLELSLEDSIHLALTNNPKIKTAAAQKEQALWGVDEAKGMKGFSLTYSNTSMRSTAPPSFVSTLDAVTPYNYISHDLTLAVPLYTGGKLENAIEAKKLGAQIADLSLETNKQQVKLDATVGFYQVIEAKDLVKVAQESVDSLTEHLNSVQQQFDAGVVAKADILRSKVQVANVQDNLITAENNYAMAMYQLNHVMGLPLRGELELKSELTYQPYSLTMEESVNYALKNRVELEQSKDGVAIAEDQIKIAKGEKLPTVSLSGTNTWDSMEYPGTGYNHWTVELTAQWDLFDSGVSKSKIEEGKYAMTAASEQAKDMKDNITLEVSQSYLSLREAEKRIETNKVAVDEAGIDFEVAQKRYSNGLGINLDVIDAELALNTAKTNYIRALYDYNVSRAKLDKAIGVKVE